MRVIMNQRTVRYLGLLQICMTQCMSQVCRQVNVLPRYAMIILSPELYFRHYFNNKYTDDILSMHGGHLVVSQNTCIFQELSKLDMKYQKRSFTFSEFYQMRKNLIFIAVLLNLRQTVQNHGCKGSVIKIYYAWPRGRAVKRGQKGQFSQGP